MAILERRRHASGSELKWFGLVLLALSSMVAGILTWQGGPIRTAGGIVSLGAVFCLLYYTVRSLQLPIYRGFMLALYPIGWLVSHVVLLGIWYGVITPIGLVLRVVGYDPLERRFDRSRSSYWVARSVDRSAERYFQQF